MSQTLSSKDIQLLRQRGLLKETETAMLDGTTVVAEDNVTRLRRILDVKGLILETSRQILCD